MKPSFKDSLKIIIPDINDQQIAQLEKFTNSLREWNQRHNLISRKDEDRVWEYHILPSLIPLPLIEFPKECWLLDIGSGGGVPAIPIKIIRPDLRIMMVDSVRKKTLFLQKVILDLQLKDIAVKRERIESLTDSVLAEKFDIITVRAVANVSQLIDWSRPFLKKEGFLLLWKGLSDVAEMEGIANKRQLNHEIVSVPDQFKSLSQKLEELYFFKIWP